MLRGWELGEPWEDPTTRGHAPARLRTELAPLCSRSTWKRAPSHAYGPQ